MKINELRSIIREVIVEEIANESANKKKVAIAEIKHIIAENELSEADVEEAFFKFRKKPEEKLAELEAELKSKNPETYKSWVDAITTLRWREKGQIQMMVDSIEKYAQSYGYPEDGKYVVNGNVISWDTSKKGGKGFNPNPMGGF
jgi:DNA-binding transcriptional MerR regulator